MLIHYANTLCQYTMLIHYRHHQFEDRHGQGHQRKGGLSASAILYLLTVSAQCISIVYQHSVLAQCISVVYQHSVLAQCISIVYQHRVLAQCISIVYQHSVLAQCISIVYQHSVLAYCISIVYQHSVLWSMELCMIKTGLCMVKPRLCMVKTYCPTLGRPQIPSKLSNLIKIGSLWACLSLDWWWCWC